MKRWTTLGIAACATSAAAHFPAQATTQPVATAPVTLNSLADMPNTDVRYYDVTASNVFEINRSITRQRPKSKNGNPTPASTDWAIRAEFDRTNTDGQCRVTAARAGFTATADLPRLADDAKADKPLRERWQSYVGRIEQNSIATLVFVYENLGRIEQAMLSSDCETAKSVAAAAIEQLRVQAVLLDTVRERQLARQNESLAEFRPIKRRDQKVVCQILKGTGSRLNKLSTCMELREWEKLAAESEAFTRKIQDSYNLRWEDLR
ncbi:MAG: DUF922 domain-containing protein [Pseudomonadota bacterium]